MQKTKETLEQTELQDSSYQASKPQPLYQQQKSSQSFGSVGDSTEAGGGIFSSWGDFKTWMIQWRGSRRLVLVIVAIALLLDNMLLTVVGE